MWLTSEEAGSRRRRRKEEARSRGGRSGRLAAGRLRLRQLALAAALALLRLRGLLLLLGLLLRGLPLLLLWPVEQEDDGGDVVGARLALQPQLVRLAHQGAGGLVRVAQVLRHLPGEDGRGGRGPRRRR